MLINRLAIYCRLWYPNGEVFFKEVRKNLPAGQEQAALFYSFPPGHSLALVLSCSKIYDSVVFAPACCCLAHLFVYFSICPCSSFYVVNYTFLRYALKENDII